MKTNCSPRGLFHQFSPQGRCSTSHRTEPSRGFSGCQTLRAPFGPSFYAVHKPSSHTCQFCIKRIFYVEYFWQKWRSALTFFLKESNFLKKSYLKNFPHSWIYIWLRHLAIRLVYLSKIMNCESREYKLCLSSIFKNMCRKEKCLLEILTIFYLPCLWFVEI